MNSKHRKRANAIWIVITVIAALSMVAFTILPLLTAR